MKKNGYLIIGLGILIFQSCVGTNKKADEALDSLPIVEAVVTVPVPVDTWELNYFVDDFGEKTKEGYIINVCDGEFSNSATTNSRLTVHIIVTPEDIRFDMYEYGSHFMKGEGILKFRAKLPDDTEVIFSTYNDDSGINSVLSSDVSKVRELFEKYSKLRFAAKTTSSYSTSTYRFMYEGDPEEFKTDLKELASK